VHGFSSSHKRANVITPIHTNRHYCRRRYPTTRLSFSSLPESTTVPQEQTLDSYLPPDHPLHSLVTATIEACAPRQLDTTEDAHEAFRYEWGTWCATDKLDAVMETLDSVRLVTGAYDDLLDGNVDTTLVIGDGEHVDNTMDEEQTGKKMGKRIRVAGGKYWDIILHVLPKGARYQWKWTEGSWTIVQPLTGQTEVAQLRGPDRDGFYKKMRSRDLRGGGDGKMFGSSDAATNKDGAGYSTSGEVCVKYLGGPMRSYEGKAQQSTMLEVVIRPPITTLEDDIKATGTLEQLEWESVGRVLAKAKPASEEESDDVAEESATSNASADQTSSKSTSSDTLNKKLGMDFENVGGLDRQLDDIARRVLASRANPAAARKLGVSHVRGILLSGPPGCGKTLLARELSRLLGAREPQIVNGPEILDKFIGEAERRVRELFIPAEREYEEVGDASALHIIILDEMDAIARKRGSMSSDTTGVRDSVVNQLLAKIDGVKEVPNVLIVGLTNRPELLDPALLRPGRLEVQLRVELPDRAGRRDILRIHTRRMKEENALSRDAIDSIEDMSDNGMGARTDYFTGAELAGLVRSAASFALAKAVESGFDENNDGMVTAEDLELALKEVRPALGTQDDVLKARYPFGISSECSASMKRIKRDLIRFITPTTSIAPRLNSLLLVGGSSNGKGAGGVIAGGAGCSALASWAGSSASINGYSDFVRFITALDILTAEGGGGDEARATALVERFSEAREMSHSLLILDDIDQICAGSGPGAYSSIMLSTLRALLRTPPPSTNVAKAGGQSKLTQGRGKTLQIIATTSRTDAACTILHEIFEETLVVPLLSDAKEVEKLLTDCLPAEVADASSMAGLISDRLGEVGCKTALRLAERAVLTAGDAADDAKTAQSEALEVILEDLVGDDAIAARVCKVEL